VVAPTSHQYEMRALGGVTGSGAKSTSTTTSGALTTQGGVTMMRTQGGGMVSRYVNTPAGVDATMRRTTGKGMALYNLVGRIQRLEIIK
jgi:hypothetical protein